MSSRTDPPPTPADPERRPFTVAPGHRQVRSFVLREGRLTPAQKRAFDTHWSRYGLDFLGAPRDLGDSFHRQAEVVVEIGFGNGEALLHAARHESHRNLVGIEVHRPGVGRLLNGLADADREHVRVYCHDAVEVLTSDIAPGALDEVRIFFPDPWHKSRHHKRRLVQPGFVALLASRIRPGGLLHLATDWAAYAEHMFDVLDGEPSLRNRIGPRASAERPPWRPQTHFEQRGVRLGHGVWDLLYDRV